MPCSCSVSNYIPYCQPLIGKEEVDAVAEVLNSGWLTMGEKTLEFEHLLAEYTGAKYAVAVNSCTAALHLSLLALGIGKGDEVITTPFTFAATGNVIAHTGARPVFADIDKYTYNIDPAEIEKAITPKTRAIMPVHYAGLSCDMKAIGDIAREYHLLVIEDAAHAIGGDFRGQKIGSLSDSTCFSFYATKNMTTGEGGAVLTNNGELASKIKSLRLHGITADAWKRYSENGKWFYEIEECGWKYNITDIQSALGIAQLGKLDEFIEKRKHYARTYNAGLSWIEELTIPVGEGHVYHLYPLLVPNRDKFIEGMADKGIGCSVHFIPLHLHPFYQRTFGYKYGDFPVSEWVYERELSLPLYPKMSIENVLQVIEAAKEIMA